MPRPRSDTRLPGRFSTCAPRPTDPRPGNACFLYTSEMTISPRIPRIASITAFGMALLVVLGVLFAGPIVALPMASVPLAASIGIAKGRAWSAYGFALYILDQLLLVPMILSR